MIEILQEVTEWSDGTPNHTYLVDKGAGKMLAYRRSGDGEVQVFSKPMTFSKSYRKFKRVVDNELEREYTVYNS